MLAIFVAALAGFLLLAAASVYWFLVLPSKPQTEYPSLSASEEKSVLLYFGNGNFNGDYVDCELVFPVSRHVAGQDFLPTAAVKLLLLGPTRLERDSGYFSMINGGTEVNFVRIDNGVAFVDFDEKIEEALGGSCRVGAIRAQINATLLQFPEIKQVVISVNGRVRDALQP
jgi:spore germination protein GerM